MKSIPRLETDESDRDFAEILRVSESSPVSIGQLYRGSRLKAGVAAVASATVLTVSLASLSLHYFPHPHGVHHGPVDFATAYVFVAPIRPAPTTFVRNIAPVRLATTSTAEPGKEHGVLTRHITPTEHIQLSAMKPDRHFRSIVARKNRGGPSGLSSFARLEAKGRPVASSEMASAVEGLPSGFETREQKSVQVARAERTEALDAMWILRQK